MLEYFQRNAAGEYIYTGAHMTYVAEGKSRKRLLAELWTLGIGGQDFQHLQDRDLALI